MTVTYTMTQSDWWGLNRYVYTHDIRQGAFATVALLIPPAVAFTAVLTDPQPWPIALRDAILVLIVWAPVVYLLLRLKTWSLFRAWPAELRDVDFAVSPSGIDVVTPKMTQAFSWSAVTKVRRDQRSIYLFMADRMPFIIPLRAFQAPEDAERFLAFVNQHTGRPK